jgi:CheY-like chemotaxis protein
VGIPLAKGGHPMSLKRIVVADDNQDLASSLVDLLRLIGHQAWPARDGLEALALVAVQHPDVVVLDLGMPNLDGIETAKRIRAMPPPDRDVLLVALTARGQPIDREQSQSAGFNLHFTKPANTDDLLDLLESAPSTDHGALPSP